MRTGAATRFAAVVAVWLGCAGAGWTAAPCPLQSRTLPVAGGTIAWDETGQGPAVVLVHGLFADRRQWHGMACLVARAGYRVIAPDLPGFGDSTGFAVSTYRLEMQATVLQAFLHKLELSRYHLAGNSMGGAIAGMVAVRFPQEVASLAFIGASLGVVGWNEPLREAIDNGVNPFIPVTVAELELELALLFVAPPALSDAAKAALVAPYVSDNLHYVQVWNIVNLYGDVLIAHPPAAHPALILWGAQDRVYSVNGAAILARAIPGSETHVLQDAGHLLHVERSETAAAYLVRWLQGGSRTVRDRRPPSRAAHAPRRAPRHRQGAARAAEYSHRITRGAVLACAPVRRRCPGRRVAVPAPSRCSAAAARSVA